MVSKIDSQVQCAFDAVWSRVTQLAQPGAILGDIPVESSYSVTKVTVACEGLFSCKWFTETGLETRRWSSSCSQTFESGRLRFRLAFQPEEIIDLELKRHAAKEVEHASIDLSQLDMNTRLIYIMVANSNEARVKEAVDTLVILNRRGNMPNDPTQNRGLLEPLLRKAFEEHPGLFKCALEHQDDNLFARNMILTIFSAHKETIYKEKDRIARIQDMLQEALKGIRKSFSKQRNECLALQQEKEGDVEEALKSFKVIIQLENDSESQIITFEKSV